MWKKINKILHDKNDYHLDPTLKYEVEISDELLQNTIKYQKYLIPKKIKYFLTYDKFFFVRLFAKYLFRLIIIAIFITIISIILLFAFGIDINFNKIQKPNYSKFPVYIPSVGDSKKDSLNIIEYKRIYNKNGNYIIFYLKDPSKNYEKWKYNLSLMESGTYQNPYDAKREGSEFWGKYQMGGGARIDIGLGNITWEKWKSNPELQEAALRLWIDFLYQNLKPEIEKYDGKFLNGWSITESGIIAMAHNVGPEAVRQFLNSGGANIPRDGSGFDATRFLILGNYELEFKK